MAAILHISITPEGLAVIAAHKERPERLARAIQDALSRGLYDIENHLKKEMLRGGDWKAKRNGALPLAVRSGGLISSISHGLYNITSGFVGVINGPATKYARALLGPDTTTITPKSASHLWVPIADNLNTSGQMKFSPSWAMSQVGPTGKRLLRIFKSKAGNLVAFLPAAVGRDADGGETVTPTHGKFKRGKRKGKQKGLLLFVLKDSITLQGTDALAKAFEARRPVFEAILQDAVEAALDTPGSSTQSAGGAA